MTMDDRKDAFEKKFANDAEFQFKVIARRNKLLGLLFAEKLGKEGDAAEAYAKEVVMADFDEPGDDDVLRKVLADVQKAGLGLNAEDIRFEMERLLGEAKAQMMDVG